MANEVKQAVVEAVFDGLASILHGRLADDPRTCNCAIEVHPISALQRGVRVKTPNQGTHHFIVKVSEVW